MSWRDIQGKKIEEVIPIDQSEVVLKLEGGKLARISARAPADTAETPKNQSSMATLCSTSWVAPDTSRKCRHCGSVVPRHHTR